MSGYLARLAARAQGAPPAAGPRPRSIFEGSAAPSGLLDQIAEVSDERMPQPGASRPAAQAAPGAGAGATATTPLAPVGAELRSEATEVASRTVEPSRDAGERHPSPGPPSAEPATATTAEAPSRAAPDRRETLEMAMAGAVAALAETPREPVPTRPQSSDRPTPEQAPTPPEPAVVHVTIGRVDVRTSIATPAPPAPTARAVTGDKVLSLHDYLRGERAR